MHWLSPVNPTRADKTVFLTYILIYKGKYLANFISPKGGKHSLRSFYFYCDRIVGREKGIGSLMTALSPSQCLIMTKQGQTVH